jgi:hypothetical protein
MVTTALGEKMRAILRARNCSPRTEETRTSLLRGGSVQLGSIR